jgi:hypothetical protein
MKSVTNLKGSKKTSKTWKHVGPWYGEVRDHVPPLYPPITDKERLQLEKMRGPLGPVLHKWDRWDD